MSDLEARAASRSRSQRGRSLSAPRVSGDELASRLSQERASSLGGVLENESSDETAAEAPATAAAAAAAAAEEIDDEQLAGADALPPSEERLQWCKLLLQMRTHFQSLNDRLSRRRDADTHDDAAEAAAAPNDITDESLFARYATGYHDHLFRTAAADHPEALIPLWHAFRSLGGRWTRHRIAKMRDEAFVVTIPPQGEPQRWQPDLTSGDDLGAFRTMLATPRPADDASTRIVVVPDLSALFVELLGGLLRLDHRIFSNHLWSEHTRPFMVPNPHMLDPRADTEDPPHTMTLDIDTEAVMIIGGKTVPSASEIIQTRTRKLSFFRQPPSFFPFIDRTFDLWPASLATGSSGVRDICNSFHTVSRATVHWIERKDSPVQMVVLLTPSTGWAVGGSDRYTCRAVSKIIQCGDYNSCFLHSPTPTVSKSGVAKQSERDRYCKDFERILRGSGGDALGLSALQWLAEKFVASTAQHIHVDSRRLAAFRHAQDPKAATRRAIGAPDIMPDAEAAHDPLRDLQYLRDRVARRQQTAEHLSARIREILPNHSIPNESESEHVSTLRSLLSTVSGLQRRLELLQSQINAAQSDVSASLQRRLTLLQLEEARKSIAQGAMVRKLTALAFVFVPISATASAFGMNLGPLLDNPPPIYSFIVAGVGLTLLLVALASADYIASMIRGLHVASKRASPRVVADPTSAASSRTNTDRTPPLSRHATPGLHQPKPSLRERLAQLPAATVVGLVEGVRLAILPLRLGVKVLQHVHAEGKAIREREDQEVDGFLRARFAFDESPGRVWWEGVDRGWRGNPTTRAAKGVRGQG